MITLILSLIAAIVIAAQHVAHRNALAAAESRRKHLLGAWTAERDTILSQQRERIAAAREEAHREYQRLVDQSRIEQERDHLVATAELIKKHDAQVAGLKADIAGLAAPKSSAQRWSVDHLDTIKRLVGSQKTDAQIMAQLGLSRDAVRYARERLGLVRRRGRPSRRVQTEFALEKVPDAKAVLVSSIPAGACKRVA